mmetsp:Transcript_122581/g.392321  ORF Transcript_122581/g.392321 Transcript_122581/m.392321 type:complete len:329 (-) Transcript_122581:567-1553(-)
MEFLPLGIVISMPFARSPGSLLPMPLTSAARKNTSPVSDEPNLCKNPKRSRVETTRPQTTPSSSSSSPSAAPSAFASSSFALPPKPPPDKMPPDFKREPVRDPGVDAVRPPLKPPPPFLARPPLKPPVRLPFLAAKPRLPVNEPAVEAVKGVDDFRVFLSCGVSLGTFFNRAAYNFRSLPSTTSNSTASYNSTDSPPITSVMSKNTSRSPSDRWRKPLGLSLMNEMTIPRNPWLTSFSGRGALPLPFSPFSPFSNPFLSPFSPPFPSCHPPFLSSGQPPFVVPFSPHLSPPPLSLDFPPSSRGHPPPFSFPPLSFLPPIVLGIRFLDH